MLSWREPVSDYQSGKAVVAGDGGILAADNWASTKPLCRGCNVGAGKTATGYGRISNWASSSRSEIARSIASSYIDSIISSTSSASSTSSTSNTANTASAYLLCICSAW